MSSYRWTIYNLILQAELGVSDNNGRTALHYAVIHNSPLCAQTIADAVVSRYNQLFQTSEIFIYSDSNPLKWGYFSIQWNSSIPTPWIEDTSVYSGTPLFQHPELRTPLYTVELLYSNTLKWGHLCIQWNSSIPTPWNEDTSVYSGTPFILPTAPWNEAISVCNETTLFQLLVMRTPQYSY